MKLLEVFYQQRLSVCVTLVRKMFGDLYDIPMTVVYITRNLCCLALSFPALKVELCLSVLVEEFLI